jgi:hypothetical protein
MKLYDRDGQVIGVIFDQDAPEHISATVPIATGCDLTSQAKGAGTPSPPRSGTHFVCHACGGLIPAYDEGDEYVYRHDRDGWHHYHVACADKPVV